MRISFSEEDPEPGVSLAKRIPRILVLLLALGILAACEPATLFVADPFAAGLLEYSDGEKGRILELLDSFPAPREYRGMAPGDNAGELLQEWVEAATPELVFATPYLSPTVRRLAAGSPDTRFVLLGAAAAEQGTEAPGAAGEGELADLVRVRFDRGNAMSAAGALSARFLAEEGEGGRLLLLTVLDSAARRAEHSSFVSSFREEATARELPGEPLEIRDFDEAPRTETFSNLLRNEENEYDLFVVFLGEQSPEVLEQLLPGDTPFGSENLGLFDPLQERMLFSVDTRLSYALEAYLQADIPPEQELAAEARLIRGSAGGNGSIPQSNDR